MKYIGLIRPFREEKFNSLELFNEGLTFLYCALHTTQTLAVEDPKMRYISGWGVIAIIFIIVLANLTFAAVSTF